MLDIYKFSKDPKYKSYVGAIIDLPDGTKYTVTDPGVASHPGDLGHKAIGRTKSSRISCFKKMGVK